MRRLAQFAALLVIGILMGQPVAEALECSRQMCAMPSACPMEMSAMPPDCPMTQPMPSVECVPSCCGHARPQPAGLNNAPMEPVKVQAVLLPAAILTEPSVEAAAAVVQPVPIVSSSPPRFLLNRVFRI
jgi:hypothetical protein